MKKKIFVRAPVLSATGYGEQSRFALRALRSEKTFSTFIFNQSLGVNLVGFGKTTKSVSGLMLA